MAGTKYEVRIIQFYKTRNRKISESENSNRYICLGHFNYIEINDLEYSTELPLECVLDNEKKTETLNEHEGEYVLYVLRNNCPEYGSARRDFIIVSRFHCDGKTEDGSTYVSALEKAFNKDPSNMIGEFYESLELGDIVVVLYGENLTSLFEKIRELRDNRFVRDSYSYCGFREEFRRIPYNEVTFKEDRIPYASILYSIRKEREAVRFFQKYQEYIKEMGGRLVFLTGTADAMIDFPKGITHRRLIEIVNQTIPYEENEMVFDEVITHIGLRYEIVPDIESESDFEQEDLLNSFNDSMGVSWLFQPEGEELLTEFQWFKSLKRLLLVLRSMYCDCVMDDLAMILVPTVRALIQNICYAKENRKIHKFEKDITKIIEEWSTLLNQISHLEGQLYQQPELHTAHVYIPAMVLLYQQSFIQKVAELLNKDCDRNDAIEFTPLLVPNVSYQFPQTDVYFDDADYCKKPILVIKTPPELLYSPYNLSVMLCHELAHCCGIKLRRREDRLECIDRCFSRTIQQLWRAIIGEGGFYEKINEIILKKFKENRPQGGRNLTTDWIRDEYDGIVASVFFDETLFDEYFKEATQNMEYEKKIMLMNNTRKSTSFTNTTLVISHIKGHKELLLNIVRECYADIIMLILTGWDYETYFRAVFEKEYNCIKNRYDKEDYDLMEHIDFSRENLDLDEFLWENNSGKKLGPAYLQYIYRMAFVTKAVNKIIPGWYTNEVASECNWGKAAAKIRDGKYTQIKSTDRGFPIFKEEFDLLEEYFDKVASSADEYFGQDKNDAVSNSKASEIRKNLRCTKQNCFDWAGMRKTVEDYESKYRDALRSNT